MKKFNNLLIKKLNSVSFSKTIASFPPPPGGPGGGSSEELNKYIRTILQGGNKFLIFAVNKIRNTYIESAKPLFNSGEGISNSYEFTGNMAQATQGPFCSCSVRPSNFDPSNPQMPYVTVNLEGVLPEGAGIFETITPNNPFQKPTYNQIDFSISIRPISFTVNADGSTTIIFSAITTGPTRGIIKVGAVEESIFYDFSSSSGKPAQVLMAQIISNVNKIKDKVNGIDVEALKNKIKNKIDQTIQSYVDDLTLTVVCEPNAEAISQYLAGKGKWDNDQYYINIWDRLIYDPIAATIGFGNPSGLSCITGINAFRNAVQEEFFNRIAEISPCQLNENDLVNIFDALAEEIANSDRFQSWTDCD